MKNFLAIFRTMINVPTVISVVIHILDSKKIQPSYNITMLKKILFALKILRINRKIQSGTSFRVHLVMLLKLLEISPEIKGDVIECGTWKGATACSLSLMCKLTGRKLIICDSFEGLPEPKKSDRQARDYKKGDYAGTLEEVKKNISKYGAIECCEFVKGWFSDTLPQLNRSILLAYVDVDYEDSLYTCIKYIWSNLTENGFIFIDECLDTDYIALFYSEKFWRKNFNRTPPGLIGAGTGLALGTFYIGPWKERLEHPKQAAVNGAYTMKSMSGYWSYYPAENQ